jgi:CheY-like chemotaxis protein
MPDLTPILLVESSLFFRTMEKQFLNRMPIITWEANTAAQALELCRKSPPGLIYLSTDLDDLSGADCCRQIKADAKLKSIPVIMICNEGEADPADLIRHSGCDAVLSKPLDKMRFLEIGRSFLAGFREFRRPCLITVRIHNSTLLLAAKAIDISSGGLFLKTPELLPVGTHLDLEINLSRSGEVGPMLKCTGRVAWHNSAERPTKPHHPVGFGLKFIDVSDSDQKKLTGFLQALDAGN